MSAEGAHVWKVGEGELTNVIDGHYFVIIIIFYMNSLKSSFLYL